MQGKIRFSGCAVSSYIKNYITEFAVGQKVCIRSKAQKGILEPVIIKSIKINKFGNSYNGFNNNVLYTDMQNISWPESELITVEQANGYITGYIIKLKRYLDQLDACQRKIVLPNLILKFPNILN